MSETKIIKRYTNRKLYDTEHSCYVTLEEIAQMIKDGEEIQVVDNKTKDDLTAVTLAQIIVEEEKKVARMPLKLLRGIIQSGNEALNDFYQRRVADPVTQLREDVERRVEGLFRRDERGALTETPAPFSAAPVHAAQDAQATETHSEDADGEKHNPVREWVAASQGALETFQRRIDEQVKQTVSRMGHITAMGTEVDQLRQRIATLEARLVHLSQSKEADGQR